MSGSLISVFLMNPLLVVMDLKEQMQLRAGNFPSPKNTFDLPEMISLSLFEEM